MSAADDTIRLRVDRIHELTPATSAFQLVDPSGASLPRFTAGAHINVIVTLPGGRAGQRAYSLVSQPEDDTFYEIAVQREAGGTGGSQFMHQLNVGDWVSVTGPRNNFMLAEGATHHTLIAGGIGITPLLGMARWLKARNKSFSLHYAARSPEVMAYQEEVAALSEAVLKFDAGDPSQGLDLNAVIGRPEYGRHLYVCGPDRLIKAVLEHAAAASWEARQVHYELFAGVIETANDQPFELTLQQSGMTLSVPPDKSILDVMLAAGLDPLFDCRRGECGVCTAHVLEGIPEHRDTSLSDSEKKSGDTICICVSRSSTTRLVLDL